MTELSEVIFVNCRAVCRMIIGIGAVAIIATATLWAISFVLYYIYDRIYFLFVQRKKVKMITEKFLKSLGDGNIGNVHVINVHEDDDFLE